LSLWLIIPTLVFAVLILLLGFKSSSNKKKPAKNKVVAIILLASASASMGVFLNSNYSLAFYGLHLVLLTIALVLAIKNKKAY